jgi:hypothetical protein
LEPRVAAAGLAAHDHPCQLGDEPGHKRACLSWAQSDARHGACHEVSSSSGQGRATLAAPRLSCRITLVEILAVFVTGWTLGADCRAVDECHQPRLSDQRSSRLYVKTLGDQWSYCQARRAGVHPARRLNGAGRRLRDGSARLECAHCCRRRPRHSAHSDVGCHKKSRRSHAGRQKHRSRKRESSEHRDPPLPAQPGEPGSESRAGAVVDRSGAVQASDCRRCGPEAVPRFQSPLINPCTTFSINGFPRSFTAPLSALPCTT